MSIHVLRLYNIPTTKSKTDLTNEFLKLGLSVSKIIMDDPDAGFAFIEFHTDNDLEHFCRVFPRLRKNTCIYREF